MSGTDDATLRTERDAWESVSGAWRDWWHVLEEGAQPINERLVALSGARRGQRVLDVASGLGEPALTAARAVGPEGSVLGVDLAPGMVRLARERAGEAGLANVEFREGNAEDVELPAESFDAAVSRWGVMLIPSPLAALRNVRGALRPGARLAAAVWGPPERSPVLSLARRVLEAETDVPPTDPEAPGPFRLHREGQLAGLFAEAGYADVAEERLGLALSFAGTDEYVRWVGEMSSSLRKSLADVAPEARERFWSALRSAAGEYARGGALVLPGEALCVSGRR